MQKYHMIGVQWFLPTYMHSECNCFRANLLYEYHYTRSYIWHCVHPELTGNKCYQCTNSAVTETCSRQASYHSHTALSLHCNSVENHVIPGCLSPGTVEWVECCPWGDWLLDQHLNCKSVLYSSYSPHSFDSRNIPSPSGHRWTIGGSESSWFLFLLVSCSLMSQFSILFSEYAHFIPSYL